MARGQYAGQPLGTRYHASDVEEGVAVKKGTQVTRKQAWLIAGIAVVLVVAAALAVAEGGRAALNETKPSSPVTAYAGGVSFVAVGDWGREGQDNQDLCAGAMAGAAEKTGAPFVISVGDNFYENGVEDVRDPLWEASWRRVYTSPPLRKRWYSVLGNHDYRGNVSAQTEFGHVVDRVWFMPRRFFNTTVREEASVIFVFLDTSPFIAKYWEDNRMKANLEAGPTTTEQLAWFDAVMGTEEAQSADWVVVVGHHPLYSKGEHGDNSGMIAAFSDRFRDHRVSMYLAGHDHDLQHVEVDGVQHVVTGAGSRVREEATLSPPHTLFATQGFLSVSLAKDRGVLELVDYQNNLLQRIPVAPRSGAPS